MNEAFVIVIKNTSVFAGDKVRRGRHKVTFRRMVFEPEGDYAEVVDASGKIHKCSPAELKL